MTADKQELTDPIEKIVAEYLPEFEYEKNGLDFFLKEDGVFVEVKQFHSNRISGQMAREDHVIAIQGHRSAIYFAELLRDAYKYRKQKNDSR